MKLLIVDADRHLVEMLTNWLKTLGHEVYRSYTGEHALQEWKQQQPDIVVIDPNLQDIDGLMVCQEMRPQHDALVLVMMDSDDTQDEIRCLKSEADDYLHKPFLPAQFLAHLKALSRRGRTTLIRQPNSILTAGPLQVDYLHNKVTIHNKTVRLTPTESKLLHLLATNANNVCTAQQIVTHLWDFGDEGDTGLIKAHIRHLRQKIEPAPSNPVHILTIPNVGYLLVLHPEQKESYIAMSG
ncbi:MAG TPA: response regulator transcription factor [Ktedonobacteraceae bacterium]